MRLEADLVLERGRVFVGLEQGFVEALAVFGDRVLATGTIDELQALKGPRTRVVDLAGRAATPGINDGHQHLLSLGLSLGEVNLKPGKVRTLEDVLAAIEVKVRETPPGAWIFGGRYDHTRLDVGRHPYREELDRVAPSNPVLIKRTCGHMGVANSKALEAAGIDESTPDPQGGHIERQNGRLTGLLQERAQELVQNVMPGLAQEALIQGIEAAGALFASQGITSVMDAAVGNRQGFEHYLAYQEARRQRRLPVRMYLSFFGGPAGIQRSAREIGLVTGGGDEYLKVGSVKLFTDGSAGGRTAAMLDPYRCSCAEHGMLLFSDEDLTGYVTEYHAQGYQISIHAIGDAAIEQALSALETAGRESPLTDRRHRIEHCGFTTADQVERMARHGIIPAPQPVFIYEFGESYVPILGPERAAAAYPMRTWVERGMHPVASTDAPVCDSSPMRNLYSMLTRKTDAGRVLGSEQTLDIESAISAMTYNGAYGSFSEQVKGTLTPGMLADIAVFDRDLFAVTPDALLETEVDLTVLDGKIVFERDS